MQKRPLCGGHCKGNENGFQYMKAMKEFRDEILENCRGHGLEKFPVRRSSPYRAGIRARAVRGKGMCCIRGSAGETAAAVWLCMKRAAAS